MASGSFSFCDVDVKDLGLEYAPEMENTYVYRPAETSTHIETYEGHNGGYAYGIWKQPKEFILRCFFEDEYIDRGIMAQVYHLFKVGRSGKLVFDRRPWCYYYATVTEPIEENFTNYKNGLITIRLKAMYPFARSDIMACPLENKYYWDVTKTRHNLDYKCHYDLMKNSAVFDDETIMTNTSYNLTTANLSANNPILLANPGTERAALGIEIAGDVGAGVNIANATTEQSCKMVAISKAATTNVNKTVFVDPISGKTTLNGGGTKELAFLYHQYGFLELEPSFPALRNIYISNTASSNTLTALNIIPPTVMGQYVYAAGKWHKIVNWTDEHTFVISGSVLVPNLTKTTIMTMNEITVTPDTTLDISLKFIYKPTYA